MEALSLSTCDARGMSKSEGCTSCGDNVPFVTSSPQHWSLCEDIPSLNDISLSVIMKDGYMNSVDDAAAIALRMPHIASILKYEKLWVRIQTFLKDRGALLLERYDLEELKRCFGEELISSLLKIEEERVDCEKKMSGYRSGSAIERKCFDTSSSGGCGSCSDDGYYPLGALLAGVQWPEGIDPSKREQYLSPEDFFSAFKMDKEDFNRRDKHLRNRLKKQHSLF